MKTFIVLLCLCFLNEARKLEIRNFIDDDTVDDNDFCVKKNGEKRPPGPPTFKKSQDEMQTLAAGNCGHRVELFCHYNRGCPMSELSWTKDGLPLQERGRETGLSTIRISKNGKLVIEDNRPSDDGNYTCSVSNKYGTIKHSIKVQCVQYLGPKPPVIIPGSPGNHSVHVGQNVTLQCPLALQDTVTPTFTWFKHYQVNGSWTENSTGLPYVDRLQTSGEIPLPEDSVLELYNLTLDDSGQYSCMVKNQYGGDVGTGWINVSMKIEPNLLTHVEAAVLSWESPIIIGVFVGGLLILIPIIVSIFLWCKYRKERKLKEDAVENATRVATWTKKIILDFNQPAEYAGSEIYVPNVRIEKVKMEKCNVDLEAIDGVSEYEFPEDTEWEFPRDKLELGKELGEGTFGKVVIAHNYQAELDEEAAQDPNVENKGHLLRDVCQRLPAVVAVKMLKEGHTDAEMIDFIKEMETMKKIKNHVNIINLLGVCSRPVGQQLMVIVEYAEHGNLRDYLRARSPERGTCQLAVSLRDMLNFGWQVARGMQWLHNQKCLHRDLAARNVLVCSDGVVKIADFGLARNLSDTDYYRKSSEGKLPVKWMSPESLFERKCTTMSDIWSFGVLLWEIITWGDTPYKNVPTLEALLELIKSGYRMDRPGHCPWKLWDIIKSCWMYHPETRPGWPHLISSLLQLYNDTLPGEYLVLSHHSLPTPPSSNENTGDQFPSLPATTPMSPAPSAISSFKPYSKFQYSVPRPRFSSYPEPSSNGYGFTKVRQISECSCGNTRVSGYDQDLDNGHESLKLIVDSKQEHLYSQAHYSNNNTRTQSSDIIDDKLVVSGNLNINGDKSRIRCFSDSSVSGHELQTDNPYHVLLDNRSSSESGYCTSNGDNNLIHDNNDDVFVDDKVSVLKPFKPIYTIQSHVP